MRPIYLLVCFLSFAFLASGCAFNRSDFVCGSNGKPDDAAMSESGKTLADFLHWGPHYRVSF
jgi:hypothetical protein